MSNKRYMIGTRGSQLSLVQTTLVKEQLTQLFPQIQFEICIIKTTGDKNMKPIPLDSVGKGWFTKEIDKALFEGVIDIAVHSLKDLPEVLPKGLIIAAIPQREDAREALISRNAVEFKNLKKGSLIGTDSTRRKSQILNVRPDLIVKSIRGNVNTRLQKLKNGEYDGIFLAVAGLKRLGLSDHITSYFSESEMIPSPGQGALAVVIKKENRELAGMLEKLNHKETVLVTKAERAFSKALGGGCKSPVGAYAIYKRNNLFIHGFVGSVDGKCIVKGSLQGDVSSPEKVGEKLAKLLLKRSNFLYQQITSLSTSPKYIVSTRPIKENRLLGPKLERLGYTLFSFPSIAIQKKNLPVREKEHFNNISSFDWIVFTSRNGIRSFMENINEYGIDKSLLDKIKIAAVGPRTAAEIKKYQLPVHFIPSQYATEYLGNELPDVSGKKILLPRAAIANPKLSHNLKERGALVTDIAVYDTAFVSNVIAAFEELLTAQQVHSIMFTSPSTVEGFLNNIEDSKLENEIFSLPVLSIGPVTTNVLRENGFKKIYTADSYTIAGMLTKLQENIL